ncbi:MAG: hypothetical protein PHH44_05725 [bacterium]|jgi:hypothetical protein|nr:hypothetical protein [bacterium]
MHKLFSCFLLLWAILLPAFLNCADMPDISFYRSATIDGPTGLLTIPAATILDNGYYALAAHKYLFKINAGLLPGLELGVRINAEQYNDDLEREHRIIPHGKFNFLAASQYPFSASLGFFDKDIYLSFDKLLVNFYNIYATAGLKLQENGRWRAMIGLSKTNARTQYIFDKAGETYNLGYRIMLSPKIRIEIGLVNLQRYKNLDFDNFTFGLNFSEILFNPLFEKWPWSTN